jgi:hypothetical protein
MTELPKVTLRSYRPVWEGWIKGILREIDQILREFKITLSTETCTAADDLEFVMGKTFSQQGWKARLMEILNALEDSLLAERYEKEVQRALDLTQGLIHEIEPDQRWNPSQLLTG